MRTGPHYDFDHYRQLVHEITQAFCGISKEVLAIKERLHHEFDRPDLSEHLEKLQSKEKQKLELVGEDLLYAFMPCLQKRSVQDKCYLYCTIHDIAMRFSLMLQLLYFRYYRN